MRKGILREFGSEDRDPRRPARDTARRRHRRLRRLRVVTSTTSRRVVSRSISACFAPPAHAAKRGFSIAMRSSSRLSRTRRLPQWLLTRTLLPMPMPPPDPPDSIGSKGGRAPRRSRDVARPRGRDRAAAASRGPFSSASERSMSGHVRSGKASADQSLFSAAFHTSTVCTGEDQSSPSARTHPTGLSEIRKSSKPWPLGQRLRRARSRPAARDWASRSGPCRCAEAAPAFLEGRRPRLALVGRRPRGRAPREPARRRVPAAAHAW